MTSPNPIQNPKLTALLAEASRMAASDIHLASGDIAWVRVGGELKSVDGSGAFEPADIDSFIDELAGERNRTRLQERGSLDGAVTDNSGQRYRFNIYRCGGNYSIALRTLDDQFLSLSQLGLPDDLYGICNFKDGLVLVAGPTGSGKSTTLATLINRVNETKHAHIITIEDPVEFLHPNKMSRVSQRQVGSDTNSFSNALVDAVRQDPDVILVGEMRDLDTIRTAITAAETGHLVFATVHAGDSVSAIDRIVSVFPGIEQSVIRNLLSGSLRTVIAQHLLVADSTQGETSDNRRHRNRVLASEVLHVNQAASNVIGSDNLHQLQSILELNRSEGMYTLDSSLARLWRHGRITERTARSLARNPNMLRELARAV